MKTELDTFLKMDISEAVNKIDKENVDYFLLLDELGKFTRDTIGNVKIDSEDGLKIIISCLVIKAMNTLEAVVRLSRACLISEAKALLRVLIEVLIIIRCIEADPSYLDRYIGAFKVDRKKRLELIVSNPEYFFDFLDDAEIPHYNKIKAEIEDEIRTRKIYEKKTGQWANKAGLKELYEIPYRLFCADVHVGVQILENYLSRDQEGNLKSLIVRPFDEIEIKAILHHAFDLFSMALQSHLAILGIESLEFAEIWAKRVAISRIEG